MANLCKIIQKAYEIIKAKSLNMVCMLGGFHLLMSFMGSIGSLMKASGLEESMEQIYAKNTVPHIISGKAIARALRAHFLVESALVCKLMSPLVGSDDEAVEIEDLTTDLNVIANADDPTIDLDMSRYPTLSKILELLEVLELRKISVHSIQRWKKIRRSPEMREFGALFNSLI